MCVCVNVYASVCVCVCLCVSFDGKNFLRWKVISSTKLIFQYYFFEQIFLSQGTSALSIFEFQVKNRMSIENERLYAEQNPQ